MMQNYIKYAFILICCVYFYYKLLRLTITRSTLIKSVCFSLVMPALLYNIRLYIPILFPWITVLLFFIFITKSTKTSYSISFISSILSFGLSYFSFFLGVIIISPFLFILVYLERSQTIYVLIFQTLIGLFQLIFATLPFKIPRLKNGMPFLLQKSSNDIGILISIFILCIISFQTTQENRTPFLTISVLILPLFGTLLFQWWRRQIRNTYMRKLHQRELEDLQIEIDNLKKDNEQLAKIIHKDNKLIPAMEMAVRNFLEASATEREKTGRQLLADLEALAKERTGIVTSYEKANIKLPVTGLMRIDNMMEYLLQKATSHEINFHFIKDADIIYMREKIIIESDLSTLIADLVENAIIATKGQETRNILLQINIEDGNYCIHVYDSGIPFEASTISKLGKVKSTTHANDGGSGIGMMQTFDFLRKYEASFILDETIANGLYAKKLSFIFDSRHEAHIKSMRTEVLELAEVRPDFIFEL